MCYIWTCYFTIIWYCWYWLYVGLTLCWVRFFAFCVFDCTSVRFSNKYIGLSLFFRWFPVISGFCNNLWLVNTFVELVLVTNCRFVVGIFTISVILFKIWTFPVLVVILLFAVLTKEQYSTIVIDLLREEKVQTWSWRNRWPWSNVKTNKDRLQYESRLPYA